MLVTVMAMPILADSITIGDETHENVLVRESSSRYYVQFPETGETTSVAKADVAPDAVSITLEGIERDAIHEQWKANNRPADETEPTPNLSSQRIEELATASETPDTPKSVSSAKA